MYLVYRFVLAARKKKCVLSIVSGKVSCVLSVDMETLNSSFFCFSSSVGLVKVKLKLTTLPRSKFAVVCQFNP